MREARLPADAPPVAPDDGLVARRRADVDGPAAPRRPSTAGMRHGGGADVDGPAAPRRRSTSSLQHGGGADVDGPAAPRRRSTAGLQHGGNSDVEGPAAARWRSTVRWQHGGDARRRACSTTAPLAAPRRRSTASLQQHGGDANTDGLCRLQLPRRAFVAPPSRLCSSRGVPLQLLGRAFAAPATRLCCFRWRTESLCCSNATHRRPPCSTDEHRW